MIFWPWWSADSITYTDAGYLLTHGYFTDAARGPAYPLFLEFAQRLTRVRAFHIMHAYTAAELPYLLGRAFDEPAAQAATVLQSILGLLTAGLLYSTLRTLRIRKWLAFAAALLFAVLHVTCQFEMLILTQSVALFAVMLSIWLYTRAMANIADGRNPACVSVLAGIAFSAAILVRSEIVIFFAVVVLMTALLWIRFHLSPGLKRQARLLRTLAVLMPVAASPLLLAWMSWNYVGIGRFQLTTLTGWSMSEPVYNLFDRVSPEDRILGELLTTSYLIRNHPEQAPGRRFWLATPRGEVIQDHYWATFADIIARRFEMPLPEPNTAPDSKFITWLLSLGRPDARLYTHNFLSGSRIRTVWERDPNDIGDYVGKVSWELALKYPGDWLRNAADNFARESFRFNFGPPGTNPTPDPVSLGGHASVVRNRNLREFAVFWNRTQVPILTIAYIFALGLALFSPFVLLRARRPDALHDATAAILAVALLAQIAAFSLLACYMPKYAVVNLATIFICAVYVLENAKRAITALRS